MVYVSDVIAGTTDLWKITFSPGGEDSISSMDPTLGLLRSFQSVYSEELKGLAMTVGNLVPYKRQDVPLGHSGGC